MKRTVSAIIFYVFLLIILSSIVTYPAQPPDWKVRERLSKAVVYVAIINRSSGRIVGGGTGFFARNTNSEIRVFTALHVVCDVTEGRMIKVLWERNGLVLPFYATIDQFDLDVDFATLTLSYDERVTPTSTSAIIQQCKDVCLPVKRDGLPTVGTPVTVAGYPAGGASLSKRQFFSGKVIGYYSRDIDIGLDSSRFTAGISGSPIVDDQCNVVAMAIGGVMSEVGHENLGSPMVFSRSPVKAGIAENIALGRMVAFQQLRDGKADFRKRDYNAALGHFLKATEIDSTSISALAYLGNMYQAVGKTPEALVAYTRSIRQRPKDPSLYLARADIYYASADYDRAIADYSFACELSPESATSYYGRGRSLFQKAFYPAAIANFDSALQKSPAYGQAYYERGRTKVRQGDFRAALKDFDRALVLMPQSAAVCCDRATCKLALGNAASAIRDYREAIGWDPCDPTAYYGLASHYRDVKDCRSAIAVLDSLFALEPEPEAEALDLRARAKTMCGE